MATYYVSNTGNNSLNGLSEANAWQTIAKVNGFTFAAGDIVAFKRGDTWREILYPPRSGTSGAYMKFTNYGTGVNPRILGSTKLITWTETAYANKWQSATSVTNPLGGDNIGDVYFENTNGTKSWGINKAYTSNLSNLTAEYHWCWYSNRIYVYATSDPDTRYTAVEAAQRNFSVQLNDKDYIEIDGIDTFYGMWGGIRQSTDNDNPTGFTLRNCESAFHGLPNGYGYSVYLCYNQTLIEDCVFHDCGRRGVSINNYGSYDISNVIIQRCTFYNGFHTTGPDIEAGSPGKTGDLSNVTIRNNLIWDDPNKVAPYTISIWLQGPHEGGTGELRDVYVYNNIIKYESGRAIGIEKVYGLYIYNNTFYGDNTNNTAEMYQVFPAYSSTNVNLKNNIYFTQLTNDFGSLMATYSITTSQVKSDYNLYYAPNNTVPIVYSGAAYHMNDIALIRSTFGWETHSPTPANPNFVSTTDYRLQAGSPAIHSGVYLSGLVDTDYNGYPRPNPPSLGALEYGTTDETTTPAPTTTSEPTTTGTPTTTEATTTIATTTIATTTAIPTTTEATTTPIPTTTIATTTLAPTTTLPPMAEDNVGVFDLEIIGAEAGFTGILNSCYFFGSTGCLGDFVNRVAGLELLTISISCWFKTDLADSAYHVMVSNYANGLGYSLSLNPTYHIEWYVGNGTGETKVSAGTYNNNAWHHVVVTFDGSVLVMYIDGSIEGTPVTWAHNIAYDESCRFLIGARYVGPFEIHNWERYLDEVGIWDRVLNSTEVSTLYNAGTGLSYPF